MSNRNRSRRSLPLSVLAVLFSALLIGAALLAVGFRTVRADPGTIYVDAEAPGPTHDGASWTTAFTSLQDALTIATAGDEIWVAQGVYYPDEGAGQTNNARTSSFRLRPGVALYGGFDPQSSAGEWAERDWDAHVTVLSGDIDGDDVTDANGVVTDTANIKNDNAYHVVTGGGVTETARLDGFTVTAGKADGISGFQNRGGGMFNDGSSPTLANVCFTGNLSDLEGGGMWNANDSNPTLVNVSFSGNWAKNLGGGMYNYDSSPVLTDATFSGNWASLSHGGGMFNYVTSSPALTNVTFSGNGARLGGGMYNFDRCSPTLTNVLFSGNWAEVYGGGLRNYRHSHPRLTNVTFSGNQAGEIGGGMANGESSSPTVINCILWGNAAPDGPQILNAESSNPTISYSDVQGSGGSDGWDGTLGSDGGNNIDANPVFVAPVAASAAPTTEGDYRLWPGSRAIDAGDNLAVTVDTDLDGTPRILDGDRDDDAVVDMGPYEAQPVVGGVTVARAPSGLLALLAALVGLALASATVMRRRSA